MSTDVALPVTGEVIGGKYALIRVIGEGGMGVVYEATHVKLRQRVALKLLLPDLLTRPDVLARFEREARAAISLSGAHVARVLDVDVLPDGLPYMVMEYLEGRDLAAELAERGALPVHEAVDWVLQACTAMVEAHGVGTVHRDLKPGNLFLTVQGSGRVLKIIDFGISKIAEESSVSVTATFSALGTAPYMSPEQVRSAKNADARSDIWSLGVILHELLAGRPPFAGENVPTVVAAIIADEPQPLRSIRPEVPAKIEQAVLKALRKDREHRFQDMAAFAAAIAPYRDPHAQVEIVEVEAPPSRGVRRGAKVALGVAAVAMGVAGLVATNLRRPPATGLSAPMAVPAAPQIAPPPSPLPAVDEVPPAVAEPAAAAPVEERPVRKKAAASRVRRRAERAKAGKVIPVRATPKSSPARVDLPDSPG
jgi:tRNA A-37 threonylcarbamoyl transferase component Bud32